MLVDHCIGTWMAPVGSTRHLLPFDGSIFRTLRLKHWCIEDHAIPNILQERNKCYVLVVINKGARCLYDTCYIWGQISSKFVKVFVWQFPSDFWKITLAKKITKEGISFSIFVDWLQKYWAKLLHADIPICGWLIPWCVTLSWYWGRLLRQSNHFLYGDIGLLCVKDSYFWGLYVAYILNHISNWYGIISPKPSHLSPKNWDTYQYWVRSRQTRNTSQHG